MTSAAVLDRFDRLAIWKRGHQRAPHKPLLVLYALGRWARGDQEAVDRYKLSRDELEYVNRELSRVLHELANGDVSSVEHLVNIRRE
jgi:putative restriction endonuclease